MLADLHFDCCVCYCMESQTIAALWIVLVGREDGMCRDPRRRGFYKDVNPKEDEFRLPTGRADWF
jgi:hypothetical protein